jgi:hypothetical protein
MLDLENSAEILELSAQIDAKTKVRRVIGLGCRHP